MEYKIIFQGWLDFGSEKKFNRVVGLFQQRVENFYRSDVLFHEEQADVFREELHSIVFSRFKVNGAEKSWKNSLKVLEFLSQFAVAGRVESWLIKSKDSKKKAFVEPLSDRQSVQEWLRGRQLLEEGKEEEALAALELACAKYETHSLAHAGSGKALLALGKTDAALTAFEKAIAKGLTLPEAHLGKASAHREKEEYGMAVRHADLAIQQAIPLQPIYWEARRYKGACLLKMEDYESAIREFRLFCNREFEKGDPNHAKRQLACYQYGKALMEAGSLEEALKVFDSALAIGQGSDEITIADILLLRGMALKKAGRKGFVGALQEAADAGSEKAAELLAEVA